MRAIGLSWALGIVLLSAIPGCVIYSSRGTSGAADSEDESGGIQINLAGSKSSRTSVTRINKRKNVGPFSDAVIAGDFLYLSGEIPRDPDTGDVLRGDISAATRLVMQNIGRTLKGQGLSYEDIAMVTIYLKDLGGYEAMNQAYAEFFKEGRVPARATVQVSKLALDADMEVAVVAYRGRKSGR